MSLAPSSPKRLGRYEVLGLLATGGMAEVHLGRLMGPSGFERVVVLKRILPHLAREAEFVDMFLDEARIIAKIDHPNVVQVIELGRDVDELYLAMEFIEGESVGGFMRRHWVTERSIGYELAAYIVAQACAGLHAAHELKDADGRSQEIVHRDVSPQNIMLSYAGRVKVLDFGIAKAVDRATRTRTGELKGKVEYMSPEQCRAAPLDRRSDVFALGVILYELSVGKRLFRRGGELASLRAVCEDPIPPPRSVDPDFPVLLEAIVMRALARPVDERFASAEELRRELIGFLRTTMNVGLHEEALAQRMRELFADRLERKSELLSRLQQGSAPRELPIPEVDLQVEPPVVQPVQAAGPSLTAPAISSVTQTPGRASWLFFGVAAGLAVTVGGVGLLRKSAPAEAQKTGVVLDSAASSARTAEPPTLTPVASAITLEVVSTPPGAHLFLGTKDLGVAPQKLSLDRGTEPITIELRLEGYVNLAQELTPDVDQRIAVTLKPAPVARPVGRPPAPPAASSGGRYRKFN